MKTLLFFSSPSMVYTKLLSQQEAANFLAVDVKTVRNWTRKGRLKCCKFAHRVFYRHDELISQLISMQF